MNNEKCVPPEPPKYGCTSEPFEAPQDYSPPSYSQHGYPPQEYRQQGYPQQGYPQQGSLQQGYPQQGSLQQGFPQQVYPQGLPQGIYHQGFPQQGFPQQGFPQQGFPQQGFPQQVYAQQTYPPQSFAPPQNYGPPPPQHFVPPPTQPPPQQNIIFVRPNGWYNRTKMNRPQSNSLSAASLIFVTGGMNLAWSIGFRSSNYYNLDTHVRVAWFIGAIIGAAISVFLPKAIPRKVITLFCSMLVLIGGIVNCSTHHNLNALMANLYLNGIANGLVFAPTLALAGELSVFYMRGKLSTCTEQLSLNLGIFLQIVICPRDSIYHSGGYNFEQVNGIIAAVFGFMGLVFATLLLIESPVSLVASGREQAATDALRRLQRLFTPNDQTLAQLEEHKRYVAENENLTTEQSFSQAIPAFIKLSILRCLNAICISSFFYDMLYFANVNGYYWNMEHCLIFGGCRLLGSFIASFIVDSLGRKMPTIVGLAGSTAFAFVAASQVCFSYRATLLWLYFFQFFAGLTFTMSSAYLSEAYPLKVKLHFISFTYIVELLVFIITGASDLIAEFMYIVGGLLMAAFVLAILCLPETRRTTLRGAQERFRNLVSLSGNNANDAS